MAKKTHAKKPSPIPPAEPFFRPFAGLVPKKQKASAGKAEPHAATAQAPAAAARPKPAPPPARAAAPQAPPPLIASEAETFAMYMSGVRSLDSAATRIPTTASRVDRVEQAAPTGPDPDAEARAAMRALVTEGIRFDVSDDGHITEGRRIDVDPRELRRLRSGAHHVDGKLDLHGLGAGEAREALEAFLRKRRTEGDRVVLVVHGKGAHSRGGVAVLRGEIGAWLSQGRAARDVAAFTSVPDDDGRSGSLLVLLAR